MTKLRLEVQKGTDNFAGAGGVLEGKGTGAFTGEGAFVLDVSGTLATDGKKKTKFKATLHGDSSNSLRRRPNRDHAPCRQSRWCQEWWRYASRGGNAGCGS